MGCQKYAVFWVDLDRSLEVEKPVSLNIPDNYPFVLLEHYEENLQVTRKETDVIQLKCTVLLKEHVHSLA